MSYEDTDALLNGGGGPPSLKFPSINTVHRGTVVSVETRDDTDPTGQVRKFGDGKARQVLVVTLRTEYREDPEDDGLRRAFLKFHSLAAVRNAVQAANAPGLRPGGTLVLKYSADDNAAKKVGQSAPKLYEAAYRPPAEAQADSLLGASTTSNSASAIAAPAAPAPSAADLLV